MGRRDLHGSGHFRTNHVGQDLLALPQCLGEEHCFFIVHFAAAIPVIPFVVIGWIFHHFKTTRERIFQNHVVVVVIGL